MAEHRPAREYRDFRYNRAELKSGWKHAGWGNFARAFIGDFADDIAEKGFRDFGLVAIAPSDRQQHDIEVLSEQDNIFHLVRRNGREICQRIGALKGALIGVHNPAAVVRSFAEDETRLVTLTVTKDGYFTKSDGTLNITSDLRHDLIVLGNVGPSGNGSWGDLRTVPGWIMAALYDRYRTGRDPFIVMSCDNLPGNGRLTAALLNGLAQEIGDGDFAAYVRDKVVCPNTAVDRITPKQNYYEQTHYIYARYNKEDDCAVVSEDHFEFVIENNGRLPADMIEGFAKAGASFVDDIRPYQDRKIRILNGAHMLFGLAGTILQVPTVREAMQHPVLRTLLDNFLDQVSGALQATQPEDVHKFREATVKRFLNPHLTDQTSRLVADTTSKVHARLLNAEALRQGLPADASAFAVAIWLRYLQGRDSSGNPYSLHDKDNDTLATYGLDLHNPKLQDNIYAFLKKGAPHIDDAALAKFSGEIVDYARLIQSRGLARAVEETFPRGAGVVFPAQKRYAAAPHN